MSCNYVNMEWWGKNGAHSHKTCHPIDWTTASYILVRGKKITDEMLKCANGPTKYVLLNALHSLTVKIYCTKYSHARSYLFFQLFHQVTAC